MLSNELYEFITARMDVSGADDEPDKHIDLPLDTGRYLPSYTIEYDENGSMSACCIMYKGNMIRRAGYMGCLGGKYVDEALAVSNYRGDDVVFGFEYDGDSRPSYLCLYPSSVNWREEIVVCKTKDTLGALHHLMGKWSDAVRSIYDRLPEGYILYCVKIPLSGQKSAQVSIRPLCIPTRGLDSDFAKMPELLGYLGMEQQVEVCENWMSEHLQPESAHTWEVTVSITPDGIPDEKVQAGIIAAHNLPRKFTELLTGEMSDSQRDVVKKAQHDLRMPYLNGKLKIKYMPVHTKSGYLKICFDRIKIYKASPVILFSADNIENVRARQWSTARLQWHITDNCDQRCKHCYIFAENAEAKLTSTPYEKLIETLDMLEDYCGKDEFDPFPAITGGDPILYPRFWDFAEEMYRRGLNFSLLGNPFHLTPEVCDRLFELGCFEYQLSVDGPENFHDSMRKPGSFRATMAAQPMLQSAGIWTAAMMTVSGANIDLVPDTMRICVEQRFGSFAFARYCPTSRENAVRYHIEPQRYKKLIYDILEMYNEYRDRGVFTRLAEKDHLFTLAHWERGEFRIPEKAVPGQIYDGCHCGQGVCILPNRDVVACRRMDSCIGNLGDSDIDEIYTGTKAQYYRDMSTLEKCPSCELYGWCRGCVAVGNGYTGDFHSADPQCWK